MCLRTIPEKCARNCSVLPSRSCMKILKVWKPVTFAYEVFGLSLKPTQQKGPVGHGDAHFVRKSYIVVFEKT